MDSGHLELGETLEDDYDVLQELLPEEVIGIMDQMLCFEVRSSQSTTRLDIYLILIPGIVDGMAYGFPTLTVPIHLDIPRSNAMARTEDSGGRPFRA